MVRPLVAKLVAILVAKPSGHTPLLMVIPNLSRIKFTKRLILVVFAF
jgi:hypothetical protein